MRYDFLNQFDKRMRSVGNYAILMSKIVQKQAWKEYGLEEIDERVNVSFAVLLYIMERSINEEQCTLDDMASFIDYLFSAELKKPMPYDKCRSFAKFLVQEIFADNGKGMEFRGYDFDTHVYTNHTIRFIENRAVNPENSEKKATYKMTNEGYAFIWGTLEIEDHIRVNLQDILLNIQLEHKNYGQAAKEAQHLYELLHVQFQKIQSNIEMIRRNVLEYSVTEYKSIIEETLSQIKETMDKLKKYRKKVQIQSEEIKSKDIGARSLNEKSKETLKELQEIEKYLQKSHTEAQKIMSRYFDLKTEYTNALKEITLLQNIKRFPLRKELFNKLFENPEGFEGLHIFLHPLFNNDPSPKSGRQTCKIYNLNKAFEPQYIAERQETAGIQEFEDFDVETYEKEKEEKRQKKQQMYKDCLSYLLECAIKNGGNISLSAIANTLTDAGKENLLPNVNVFKEVYVEFSKTGEIDVAALKEEQKNTIPGAKPDQFELNNTILELGLEIKKAEMSYIEGADKVVFENVEENGKMRNVRCADMLISVTGGKADDRRF